MMPMFTDAQMIEIGKARERMRAYVDKIQMYPALPPDPEPQPTREVWNPKQWDRLQQLEGRVIHCENKLAEMRSIKRGDKYIIK